MKSTQEQLMQTVRAVVIEQTATDPTWTTWRSRNREASRVGALVAALVKKESAK